MKSALSFLTKKQSMGAVFLVTSILVLFFSILTPVFSAQAAPQPTQSTTTTQSQTQTQQSTTTQQNTNSQVNSSGQKQINQQEPEEQSCDDIAGPLGFMLCPIYDQITKLINWLAGPNDSILTNLLSVPPLQFNNDQGLFKAYTNVLNFTNSLFIIVFLVMIFANFIGDFRFLDSYNVKSVLPRLIAAIILAQFGYLIVASLIDIGNILGYYGPKLISQGVLGPNVAIPNLTDGTIGLLAISKDNIIVSALGGTIVFLLLLLMAIMVVGALLLTVIYMVARYLILIILIFAAPLAFLAWVLPGTQPFFYKWGRNLIKLVLMYPLVMILITTAEILSFMLLHPTLDPSVYSTNKINILIGGLIPFVALLMIPKCLKLSGDIMAVTGAAVAGYAVGKSKEGGVKAKEGAQNRVATSEKFGENRLGRMVVAGPSGLSKKSAKATAKIANTRDRSQALYDKVASNSKEGELVRMLNQKYRPAKIAAVSALAKSGNRMAVQDALQSGKIDKSILDAATKRSFDDFKGIPDIRSNWDFDNNRVDTNKFFSGLNASTWADANGASQQEWVLQGTRGADGKMKYSGYDATKISRIKSDQWRSILQDKSVRSKMNEDVRRQLNRYATDHAHTATARAIRDNIKPDGSWL